MLAISLDVSFGESEVKEKDFVGSFVVAYTKIIRLYIAMDEISVVHVFNSGNHLVNQHQHRLKGEFP